MMRYFSLLFLLLVSCLAEAATPPMLQLDVARFRNEDVALKGAVVEIYATVSGKSLRYMRRAPKMYQAAAALTLEVIRPDGQAVYQETVVLKPPVLSDTTAVIKNPLSFQKRLLLPEGTYTLRALVRDQYQAGKQSLVEQPLVLAAVGSKPQLSDLLLLARAPVRGAEASNFSRGGYGLTRAPGGLYARGANRLWMYAELYNVAEDQPLVLRYRLRLTAAKTDALVMNGAVRGQAGRPTPVLGELDLSKLPSGDYTLTVEVRNAKNQLLTSQATAVRQDAADYAPAGAGSAR
ncbi:hypothetical protein [Hymenobacter canadensis]|uniref:Macroglobulin domain-containing protein n=1 Tax=Hymenobacter canadensis TaxID=2999067 RepID=A0ABY7LQ71_9BACT|nr:hypothetical protein [Hymenobacter canadensis]WBA42057.1 hypothetical protein O3303_00520 [Hymenobacter canadensis]